MEHVVDGEPDERVAKAVERALVLGKIRRGKTVADDHVDAVFKHFLRHGGTGVGGVRVVSVDHDVALRVDVLEHAADDVPLPLLRLGAHDGARGTGNGGGVVGGVVVIDIDDSLRQDRLPVGDDFLDGLCFVVTGY